MKKKKLRQWMLREFSLRFATQIRENKIIFSEADVLEYMRGSLQKIQDDKSLISRAGVIHSRINLNAACADYYHTLAESRKRKEMK